MFTGEEIIRADSNVTEGKKKQKNNNNNSSGKSGDNPENFNNGIKKNHPGIGYVGIRKLAIKL